MWIIDEFRKLLVRRNHKDSLFCDLFSVKEYALSLYNAIRGTDYTDLDGISIVTIKDVIFMHQKNDVSILFDHRLTLWEHQSTLNRNMPLRGMLYYSRNLEGIFDKSKKRRLYLKPLVKIPAPEYYVFYNGTEEAPEREDMRLSDAFEVPSEGYEWTAHLINVNAGRNDDIMDCCPALKGYALLVEEFRDGKRKGLSDNAAAERAIQKTIDTGYLVDYLGKIQAEAKTMILTEFDAKAYEEDIREEAFNEGRAEGSTATRTEDIKIFISDKREDGISDERIKERVKKYYGLDDSELGKFF